MTAVEAQPAADAERAVFRVADDTIEAGVLAVRRDGERHVGSASGTVEYDLEGVQKASSVVLSLMLCWKRAATAQGRGVRFSGIGERLLDLARLNRVDDILELDGSPSRVSGS
ncbi:STAS domain-containing protein [Marinobacter sp. JSM 1782161]|uniref:STAS domain-containing protein n=1 Tax=Marinobacter sp. JSM 1782161 TaxID=2685906 RepID=UPI0014038391|nr:STAS domain-containing protein [Marinobacter sp. JSM 1782161]